MADGKHTQAVKIWLTEQEFADLAHMAACKDRKVSEMCRVLVRQGMYGRLRCPDDDVHGAISADPALATAEPAEQSRR